VSAKMSVVICSLNGAEGVDRCLRALAWQTIRSSLELIVVDDGSTDSTSGAGRAHGAIVVRHVTNLGLAAARNSGLAAATAPVVAFLDDDCEPEQAWAEQLLTGYEEGVIGTGGPILPGRCYGFIMPYLKRNNPLKPQEANLADSDRIIYRLKLYTQRQWARAEEFESREVYSFAGANMSFLRQALIEVGRFDERFRFAGEELDLCIRLRRAFPCHRLMFIPKAQTVHHFKPSMRDILRRSRAYGRGSARLYRKWPSLPPTLFPGPLLVLAMLLLSKRFRPLAAAAFAIPHLFYPKGLRYAILNRSGETLLDAYIQLAQETCGNIGFIEGLWLFRHIAPDEGTTIVQSRAHTLRVTGRHRAPVVLRRMPSRLRKSGIGAFARVMQLVMTFDDSVNIKGSRSWSHIACRHGQSWLPL
jgi:glycosyltransferase involved in cell wall biosynthesis